ncbi:MAG: hypothetical protein ACE5NC_02805 [Anaerolineae bacterium]
MTTSVQAAPSAARPLPPYAILGAVIIAAAEILMLRDVEPVATWFTPVAWTGYILMVDGLVLWRRGHSLLHDRPREFVLMLPLSVGIWLIFEAFNLHLRNWHYLGVPPSPWREIGFFWSFATILPGLFETADLLTKQPLLAASTSDRPTHRSWHLPMIALGMLLLTIPLLLPGPVARYLFGMVWLGFILLVEPLNHRLGHPSLLGDWEAGRSSRLLALLLAGLICGFLWEFWNFWAHGKWIYSVPIVSEARIFEMPILGFAGFPPFALECFALYQLAKGTLNRLGARL